ncbi:MAG: peptidylprolyl isomerase [Deltaproteobacteria bacterium]|nr:peptidylprolyl isomerase [Deltaproteobacteria bacterium]
MHRIPFPLHSLISGLCLLLFFAVACGMVDQTEDNVVIIVGTSHITADKLKADMAFISAGIEMPLQQDKKIRDQVIEQCINHYLIVEYGKQNNISISEKELQNALEDAKKEYSDDAFDEALLREYIDIEQWKDRLREQLLENKIIEKATDRIASPNYEEIKQYYDTHQDAFKSPKMIEFRQIVTRTREEAKNLRKKLLNGEQMSELARKYSVAPEAENGGNVGWVAKGHLNDSMEKVLFSMQKGKISNVIETPYGYHIFEVLSVRSAGQKNLPDVIDEIEATLLLQKREAFLHKWLQDLHHTFEVKVNKDMVNNLEFS